MTIVKAHDLLDPLDSDVEHAVMFGERLDIVPTARRQRLSVGSKDRRHFGVGNASRSAVTVDDPPAKPRSAVGDRDKTVAVRLNMNGRDAAESRMARGEHETAAKFQRT